MEPGFTSVDRKSTRLNSSHQIISYAVFCLKKKNAFEDELQETLAGQPRRLVLDTTELQSIDQVALRALIFALHKLGPDVFFFNDTATTEIYTLSLHDALPI